MVKSQLTAKKPNKNEGQSKRKSNKSKQGKGWLYIGHIPHGFYEEEMNSYFEQFGKINNVRVCRSRKTGKSKGFGFIEFADEEVAKIAAKTMDNYLMFKKRLDVKFIPAEKMKSLKIVKGEAWSEENYPLKQIRKDLHWAKNAHTDNATYLKRCRYYLGQVRRSIKKLKDLGIDYSFTPVDVPPELEDKI